MGEFRMCLRSVCVCWGLSGGAIHVLITRTQPPYHGLHENLYTGVPYSWAHIALNHTVGAYHPLVIWQGR